METCYQTENVCSIFIVEQAKKGRAFIASTEKKNEAKINNE